MTTDGAGLFAALMLGELSGFPPPEDLPIQMNLDRDALENDFQLISISLHVLNRMLEDRDSDPPIFQSLNSGKNIRVLLFVEGPGMQCELREIELGSTNPKDRYRALSYVWGPAKPERAILCNGVYIKVTLNLFDALYELRKIRPEQNWWINAICL